MRFPALDFFSLPRDRPADWPSAVHLRRLELSPPQFVAAALGSWTLNYACGGRPLTINERARLSEDGELHWLGPQGLAFAVTAYRHWILTDGEGGSREARVEVQSRYRITQEGNRLRIKELDPVNDPSRVVLFGRRNLDEYIEADQIEETGELILQMTHARGRFSYICGSEELTKVLTRPTN